MTTTTAPVHVSQALAAERASWEAKQAGRAAKARAVREKYLAEAAEKNAEKTAEINAEGEAEGANENDAPSPPVSPVKRTTLEATGGVTRRRSRTHACLPRGHRCPRVDGG